jgi:hypothetical protein
MKWKARAIWNLRGDRQRTSFPKAGGFIFLRDGVGHFSKVGGISETRPRLFFGRDSAFVLASSSDIPPTGAFPGATPVLFVERYFSSSGSPRMTLSCIFRWCIIVP